MGNRANPPGPPSVDEFAAALADAAADMDANLVDLEGDHQPSTPAATPRPAAPPAGQAGAPAVADLEPEPQDHAPAPVAPAGGYQDEALQLDLDAAGLQASPSRGLLQAEAPAPGGPAPGGPAPGAPPAPSARKDDRPTGTHTAPPEIRRTSPPPPMGRPWLLGYDRASSLLLALAIGFGVALVPAFEGVRRLVRDEVTPLEEELAQSVERPLAVRAGKLREPDQIQADLDEKQGALSQRFGLVWIATGAVLGTALAFIRRPG